MPELINAAVERLMRCGDVDDWVMQIEIVLTILSLVNRESSESLQPFCLGSCAIRYKYIFDPSAATN